MYGFGIFRFLGMPDNPKISFDKSLYLFAALRLTISEMHSKPSRFPISTCVLHLLILNFLVILHIRATFEGYCC